MAEYVTCNVCEKYIAGKVPKGGDGSVLFPRRHAPLYPSVSGQTPAVCSGSFQPAREYEKPESYNRGVR